MHLSARSVGDALLLDVEDDGLGFPSNAGAGVGLSQLATAHRVDSMAARGQLVVEALARGTRVRMTIPLQPV